MPREGRGRPRRSRRQAVGRLIGVRPTAAGTTSARAARMATKAGNCAAGPGPDRPPGERLGEAPPRPARPRSRTPRPPPTSSRPWPAVEPSSSSKAATRAPAAPTACTLRRIRSGTSESTAPHPPRRARTGHSGGPEMGVAKATGEPGGGQQRDRQHRRRRRGRGRRPPPLRELDQDRVETERDDRGVRQRDPSGDRDRDPSAVTGVPEPIIAASVANGGARRAGEPAAPGRSSVGFAWPRGGSDGGNIGAAVPASLAATSSSAPSGRSPRARSALRTVASRGSRRQAGGEHLQVRLRAEASEMKARNRISAALVTNLPVLPIPWITAVSVDPVRSYSSRIRERMNTS